ncbi:MAG: metalloregulator ArsR/SmtB family transcription factor [Gammaproteobacteria bacterium]|jgi:DNA-binding transcriptional ArsR family regulator
MNDEIDCTAEVLKAIAHPTRLKILCTLNLQELQVGTLVDKTGTTQSNISQHLSLMKECKILITRREANRIYYRIRDPKLVELILLMREIYCKKAALSCTATGSSLLP